MTDGSETDTSQHLPPQHESDQVRGRRRGLRGGRFFPTLNGPPFHPQPEPTREAQPKRISYEKYMRVTYEIVHYIRQKELEADSRTLWAWERGIRLSTSSVSSLPLASRDV